MALITGADPELSPRFPTPDGSPSLLLGAAAQLRSLVTPLTQTLTLPATHRGLSISALSLSAPDPKGKGEAGPWLHSIQLESGERLLHAGSGLGDPGVSLESPQLVEQLREADWIIVAVRPGQQTKLLSGLPGLSEGRLLLTHSVQSLGHGELTLLCDQLRDRGLAAWPFVKGARIRSGS